MPGEEEALAAAATGKRRGKRTDVLWENPPVRLKQASAGGISSFLVLLQGKSNIRKLMNISVME